MNPAGLAVTHTSPFAEDSGQRWLLFKYLRHVIRRFMPKLMSGGKAMWFCPPRHGKSLLGSVYVPSWFLLTNPTKNVILCSYGESLAASFSARARTVVRDLGSIFGVRLNPKEKSATHWSVQYVDDDGGWRDGGSCYAAGVDGALPGRGGNLIVMDDVVRGHKDLTQALMERAHSWYRSVLETRREPNACVLLIMTRWAQADLAGRLLEDEPDEWDVISLPALAKEDDPLGRKLGEALCPTRFPAEELRRKRDSSEEGGLLFAALYQQEPMPEDGAVFKAENIGRWEGVGKRMVRYGNQTISMHSLRLRFATIDPALKGGERNDPTGFLVWALSPDGALILLEDHTARMQGSDDLLPLMRRLREEHHGIQFYVESVAHGTEIMRACERERLPVLPLKADRDKVTRAIGAQPAFAAGKVYLPAKGADALVRELLEFPGGRHDDRVDCVAYAVQVWRDRSRHRHTAEYARAMAEALGRGSGRESDHWYDGPMIQPLPECDGDVNDVHPDDWPEPRRVCAADRWGP